MDWLGALLLSMTGFATPVSSKPPASQLRVHLPLTLPVDPLYLRTMAEYDASLILYRPWFAYDQGRRAKSGLINRWTFSESTGEYRFELGTHHWSNGELLTAPQLIANLQRIAKSPTPYAKVVKSVVELASLKAVSDQVLTFRTPDRKPSTTLFNQFGSVFFSVVHPSDLDEAGLKVARNRLALGPYVLKGQEGVDLMFIRNPHYMELEPRAPETVVARTKNVDASVDTFLSGKAWINYVQANTLLESALAKRLLESKLPIWTRGLDRVALIRPLGKGDTLARNRTVVQRLGHAAAEIKIFEHPLKVELARSLQPLGYPLYQALQFPEIKSTPPLKVRVVSYDAPQLALLRSWLDALGAKAGVQIEWKLISGPEFLKFDWDKVDGDLGLFSFGVADPEPTTWLSLVFGSKFIWFSEAHETRFHHLIAERNVEAQVSGYRALLADVASEGGYLPLIFGATISVGQPGMSFEAVDPLDETVDYSKIRFSK